MSKQSTLIAVSEDMFEGDVEDTYRYIRQQAARGLGFTGQPDRILIEEVAQDEQYRKIRQRLFRCSVERGENVQTGAPETRSA